MVRFIHAGIRVQSWVDHDAVNEVIDDGGDGVDAAEAFVKCGGLWHRIRPYKIGVYFPWYLASSGGE
jgi:hypothetical protein